MVVVGSCLVAMISATAAEVTPPLEEAVSAFERFQASIRTVELEMTVVGRDIVGGRHPADEPVTLTTWQWAKREHSERLRSRHHANAFNQRMTDHCRDVYRDAAETRQLQGWDPPRDERLVPLSQSGMTFTVGPADARTDLSDIRL